MFEINLIKKRVILPKVKRLVFLFLKVAVLIGSIIFITFVVKFISVSLKVSQYKEQKTLLAADINKMSEKYKITEWVNMWTKLYIQIDTMDKILDARTLQSAKLQGLASILLPGMCLTEINISDNNIYVKLIVLTEGKEEFEDIKQFISSLEKSPHFGSGAKIESHERAKLKGKDIKLFTISLPIKKNKNQKKNTTEEKNTTEARKDGVTEKSN